MRACFLRFLALYAHGEHSLREELFASAPAAHAGRAVDPRLLPKPAAGSAPGSRSSFNLPDHLADGIEAEAHDPTALRRARRRLHAHTSLCAAHLRLLHVLARRRGGVPAIAAAFSSLAVARQLAHEISLEVDVEAPRPNTATHAAATDETAEAVGKSDDEDECEITIHIVSRRV